MRKIFFLFIIAFNISLLFSNDIRLIVTTNNNGEVDPCGWPKKPLGGLARKATVIDDLKDKDGEHCFDSFFDDSRFYFPTIEITYDLNQASYPKEPYVSFLDHIMVTKDLITTSYKVNTIMVDQYMGGFDIYESYISDHLPVLFSFD